MKKILMSAAFAALPLGAIAQDQQGGMSMGDMLTQIELQASQALDRYGVDADPTELTVSQLARIHSAMSATEEEGKVRARLETIVRE